VATDLRGGGSYNSGLQILSEFNSEKKSENWSTLAEVIIKIKVARIF